MKSSSFLILATFLLIVAIAAYLKYPPDDTPSPERPISRPPAQLELRETHIPDDEIFNEQPDPALPTAEEVHGESSANSSCKALADLDESHPIIVDEMERLAPLMVFGATADAYRDLPEKEVLNLARSGDAMAMAVLGAQQYLKAFESDGNAIDWLKNPNRKHNSQVALKPDQIDALDRAAHWLFEASVHGRSFALLNYGQVIEARFGDARSLGWVDDPDQDQATGFTTTDIFSQVLFQLEPEMLEGALGIAIEPVLQESRNSPAHDIIQKIVGEQIQLIKDAREEQNVPPIELPPARYSPEYLRQEFCTNR